MIDFESLRKTRLGNNTAKSVLSYLVLRGNDDGTCFPTKQRVAEDTELALRQVDRILQVFALIGLVIRHKAVGQTYSHYFLINLGMLGRDLSEEFTAHYKRLQSVRRVCETVSQTEISPDNQVSVSQTDDLVSQTQLSVSQTKPLQPLIGVSTNEEPLKNQGADAPSLAFTPEKAKVMTMPIKPDAERCEEIRRMWPSQRRGAKKVATKWILAAIRVLAGMGFTDPGLELANRVRTWLAWHARESAKGFVPGVPLIATWCGTESQRYLDDEAQPAPEPLLQLPSGDLIPQSHLADDGWMEVA